LRVEDSEITTKAQNIEIEKQIR